MKRFDSKRLLAMVLAVIMVFSYLPWNVQAAETETPAADDASRDIPVSVLTATTGDYEDTGGANEGPAALVLDNNTNTLWHTDWYGTSRENHWIQFELSEDYTVDGLRYQPRQGSDSSNGTITSYQIQVSDDNSTFTTVASGEWTNDKTWKIATFEGVQAKYVRLVAVNAASDNSYVFASAAEIRLTGEKAQEHVHSFVEKVATETYLATEGSCVQPATYYFSCACGEKGTETFDGETLPHAYGAPVFTWTDLTATATFTCETDNSHTETIDATVTSQTTGDCGTGVTVVYTATVKMNGKTYKDTKSVTGEPGDHTYDNGFCTGCDAYEAAPQVDGVYQIANGGQLYWFAELVNTSGDDAVIDAVLVKNIVVNESLSDSSREWTRIGYYNKSSDKVYYSGTFDGQGHTVSGLYCVKPNNSDKGDYIGLFHTVDRNGTVKNVGVVNSEFTGRNYIGGVAGRNYYGTVSGCWNDSKISGNNNIGGVVGGNAGTVSNCYNTGTVTGTNTSTVVRTYTGGVVGSSNEGSVTDCYNIGQVVGQNDVFGIVGMTANGANIANCYYLADSETDTLDGTTAKTAAQFASGEVTYLLNGSTDEGDLVWKQTLASDSAPKFIGEVVHYNPDAESPYYNGELVVGHQHDYENGFCSGGEDCDAPYQSAELVDGVYRIANGGQLYWFAALVNGGETDADAVLANDIYVNQNVTAEGDFRAWTPINAYAGTFDGSEHTVSGLYFNDSTVGNVGLFGSTAADAQIKNLTLADSYIAGKNYVGGLVGNNTGTIENCHNGATVTATNYYLGGIAAYSTGLIDGCSNSGNIISNSYYVGGVVGKLENATIRNSYNTGIVSPKGSYVGGVVGDAAHATVDGCYNTGNVTTSSSSNSKYVGGVVGKLGNVSTATNCYNSGTVTGKARTGGVVGAAVGTVFDGASGEASTVSQCYNTGAVSGSSYVGGVAGANDNGARVENCFNAGSVSGSSSSTGGVLGLNNFYTTLDNCYNVGTVSGGNGVVGQNDNVVTDCYYLAESETDTLDGTTAKTAAQFASGEVTWLLNGSTDQGNLVWKQTLASDTAPKFVGEVVHHNPDAVPPYYNGELVVAHQHDYENGFCSGGEDCDAPYQSAELVDGVYRIANGGQLYWFAALVNGGETDADAVLANDIYVNENVTAEGDFRAWTPIGGNGTWMSDYGVQYTGTFDGAGYTVSGLYFSNESADYVGFIGTAGAGCTVKDLTLTDSFIRGGMSVGGIVGTTISDNAITGCTNAATVQGTDYVGGIVGENYGAEIIDCVNEGTVAGTMYSIGGIAGFHTDDGTVVRCVNMGTVDAPQAQRVGGLVGEMAAGLNASPSVENCYNIGAVSGKSNAGGVVGFMNSEDTAVRNCYTTTGVVVGKQMKKTSVIENCYYLSDSETDTIDGTTAKTAAQFASGEVAYLLNGSQSGEDVIWRQKLTGENADATPKFVGEIVYAGYDSCAEDAPLAYSNEPFGAKPDHTWGDWEVTTEATYSKGGEETRKCTVCDKTETRSTDRKDLPFVDVVADSFYDMPVRWAVDNGITNGTDETHFSPLDVCNRAQVVTFLWRAAGCPEPETTENPFVDVPETEFYYKAVLWAVEEGITNGMDETHFKPEAYCNRAQIVTFLWRAAGRPEPTSSENPFVDVPETEFYYEAVLWAVENGITNGMDETHFKPGADCNRAQVVTFLYRVYND